jgi:SAM-dependent methyltransferase
MPNQWNQRYAAAEYVYGTEPNAFFLEQLAGLPPGRMLLPAEGEGRNAVYAASLGWEVDAFDFSEEGRKKALALAEGRGVRINYALADLASVAIVGNYDAIGLFFVHQPAPQRRSLLERCATALAPGGVLLLEAFTPEQLRYGTGGPKDEALLVRAADLRDALEPLDIELLEERIVPLDEGPLHRGEAAVVRLRARKRVPRDQ